MTGPNPIAEALERDWDHAAHAVTGLFHRHAANAAPQTPAQQPATMKAATAAAPATGGHMSIITAIRQDIAAIDARLQAVDETALNKLDAIMANPETAAVLNDLAGLAGTVGIPAGAITGVLGGAKTLLSLYAPDPPAVAPQQAAVAPAQ